MSRELDFEATERALRQAGIDPNDTIRHDPNRRRILESLCVRHNVPAVYLEVPS
jgi:hypothetical protein